MIAYDLACHRGHEFEAWFKSARTFARQRKKGLIECPHCGTGKVEMLYRAQALGRKSLKTDAEARRALTGRIEDFLKKNFEDVGRRFAEEARDIHYGESSPRNIRGVTTSREETELREEGIDFLKIALPKTTN